MFGYYTSGIKHSDCAMQVVPQTVHAAVKSIVALLLTFTAGCVDIVGYIRVYHFFTANMTGDTVHLGNKLVIGAWAEALKAGVTIISFIVGSVLGRGIIEAAARKRERRAASFTLMLEALLIAVFIWISALTLDPVNGDMPSTETVCGLLSLLATAMGLQTATLTRIGPLTVHTTFVTGMLNKCAQAISQWLFWVHDETRKGARIMPLLRRSGQNSDFRTARFMMAIWFCYMAGAVAGTVMNIKWNTRCLYVAVLLLLLATVIDRIHPLSREEEHD
jgi:uncharacterized membrane protein YoaK (UPF0700 family)